MCFWKNEITREDLKTFLKQLRFSPDHNKNKVRKVRRDKIMGATKKTGGFYISKKIVLQSLKTQTSFS